MSFAQTKSVIEQLSRSPKKIFEVPVTYKIALPGQTDSSWDRDFEAYNSYLNRTLLQTQATMSYAEKQVRTTICPNSVQPHAQLDTATMIGDKSKLEGTWRMMVHRSIRFTDSMNVHVERLFRSDTLPVDQSSDDAFAVFTDTHFKLYVKEAGKHKFSTISSKYSIENRRFLMLYKLFKSGAGISQIGIDTNGYLILNYPAVITNFLPNNYITHITVIQQFIFEKVL